MQQAQDFLGRGLKVVAVGLSARAEGAQVLQHMLKQPRKTGQTLEPDRGGAPSQGVRECDGFQRDGHMPIRGPFAYHVLQAPRPFLRFAEEHVVQRGANAQITDEPVFLLFELRGRLVVDCLGKRLFKRRGGRCLKGWLLREQRRWGFWIGGDSRFRRRIPLGYLRNADGFNQLDVMVKAIRPAFKGKV